MVNDDSIAIYLMHTGNCGLSSQSIIRLLKLLYECGMTPSSLFSSIDDSICRAAGLSLVEAAGLKNMHLGYLPAKNEIKRLKANGINFISIIDSDYPAKLKSRLKSLTPPVLFYYGDIKILEKKSIAVVGRRTASGFELNVSRRLGRLCASECVTLVSGGAYGVDEAAQNSALSANGKAAVFYPFCLTEKFKYHYLLKYAQDGRLLMLTHTSPNSKFSAKNALTRNRFIHASGDFSIAVCSNLKRGGTWSGACDNLKNGFSPLFACDIPALGNSGLIKLGARPLRCSSLWEEGFKLYSHLSEASAPSVYRPAAQRKNDI